MGVTPEESDLMASSVADVSIVKNGIAVTNSKEVDPVKLETKVSNEVENIFLLGILFK